MYQIDNYKRKTSDLQNKQILTYIDQRDAEYDRTCKSTVVSRGPPLCTCPKGHMVSRQSQVSLWSRSFVVPWAELDVFSLKGQEQQTANQ